MDCGIIQRISPQEAHDRRMFGPVYHGTAQIEQIRREGFRFERGGQPRSGFTVHGMTASHMVGGEYALGFPPPIHWLGYGVYFTTSPKSASQYGTGIKRDIGPYWLDVPRLETINFGAPRTMMNWWLHNGFDGHLALIDRIAATERMTDYLAGLYDAVWFKGKGLRTLLDGDQVCVYDPARIYCEDRALAGEMEIGSKVIANEPVWGRVSYEDRERGVPYNNVTVPPGTRGVIIDIRDIAPEHREYHQGSERFLVIKWSPRGKDLNVYPSQVLPAPPRGRK
jgi:hypothetical protein